MKGGKPSLALLALGEGKKGEEKEDEEGAFDEAFEDFMRAQKAGNTDAAKEAFKQAVYACNH